MWVYLFPLRDSEHVDSFGWKLITIGIRFATTVTDDLAKGKIGILEFGTALLNDTFEFNLANNCIYIEFVGCDANKGCNFFNITYII